MVMVVIILNLAKVSVLGFTLHNLPNLLVKSLKWVRTILNGQLNIDQILSRSKLTLSTTLSKICFPFSFYVDQPNIYLKRREASLYQ